MKCSAKGEVESKPWGEVVAKMVLRTNQGMKEALSMLATWLETSLLLVLQALSDSLCVETLARTAMQRASKSSKQP